MAQWIRKALDIFEKLRYRIDRTLLKGTLSQYLTKYVRVWVHRDIAKSSTKSEIYVVHTAIPRIIVAKIRTFLGICICVPEERLKIIPRFVISI